MATIKSTFVQPTRFVAFKNKTVDPPAMVNNSAKSEAKPQNEGLVFKISTSESPKIDARKILTQEITLTSKAPLKILEKLEISVHNGNVDACLISEVCKYLKKKGKELDRGHCKDELDHYFQIIRDLSRNTDAVDSASRSKLTEIIELRSHNWLATEELASYYANKKMSPSPDGRSFNQPTSVTLATSISSPSISASNFAQSSGQTEAVISPSSSSEDVIKHSGKFQKPVKVPGKNFLKDEFVIKNSDSGKVNPGAKDRLLQITGPDEASINKAKYYIEDTIKRNASPVPFDQLQQQLNPLNQTTKLTSASSPVVNKLFSNDETNSIPFMQTISIGKETIVIASSMPKLALEAKIVLAANFRKLESIIANNGSRENSVSSDSETTIVKFGSTKSSNGDLTEVSGHDESNTGEYDALGSLISHRNGLTNSKTYLKSASHGSLSTGNSSAFESVKDRRNSLKMNKIVYGRDFLLQCANSAICKIPPSNIKVVTQQIPDIVRKPRQIRANSVESSVLNCI